MSPSVDPRRWPPYIWAVLAIFVALALYLIPFSTSVKQLVHDVQISLFVFALLAFTFEGITRQHLTGAMTKAVDEVKSATTMEVNRLQEQMTSALKEVQTASIAKFITAVVGPKAFEAIEPFTTRRIFTRPHMDLFLKMEPLPGQPPLFVVTLTISSEVKNETGGDAVYSVGFHEDIEHATAAPSQSKILDLLWEGRPLPHTPEVTDRYMKSTALVTLAAGQQGRASARCQFVRSAEEHYDLSMGFLTEEADVTVQHPSDVVVSIGPLGFVSGEETPRIDGTGDEVSRWRWAKPLLPSQGITIKWHPRPAAQPQFPPAAPRSALISSPWGKLRTVGCGRPNHRNEPIVEGLAPRIGLADVHHSLLE